MYWKDPVTSDTWGLNFTSPIDAKQFRECCVSFFYFYYWITCHSIITIFSVILRYKKYLIRAFKPKKVITCLNFLCVVRTCAMHTILSPLQLSSCPICPFNLTLRSHGWHVLPIPKKLRNTFLHFSAVFVGSDEISIVRFRLETIWQTRLSIHLEILSLCGSLRHYM